MRFSIYRRDRRHRAARPRSHRTLLAAALNLPLTQASVRRFADMEIFVEVHENVRGEDVFVVQSTSYPANDNLMELLITLDALRRASARRITAVSQRQASSTSTTMIAPATR